MAKAKTKRVRREGVFHVGDRVEILGYEKVVSWGKLKPQKFGYVTNVNGAYILVRPRWQKFVVERYPNELRHA